ncbi:MAG: SusC/RagA family TonB-linked outer membrane protein [Candidatus Cryptobacteroides sp.]
MNSKLLQRIYTALAVMILFPLTALAQESQRKVTGTVKDADNIPIYGATVSIQGTRTGATTDADGKYSLSVPSGKATVLEFQCLGYETTTRTVSSSLAIVDVVLEESTEFLEDAVVIGYGTVKKSDMTGSVSTVKIDKVEAGQVATFDRLLQGKAAGVQVTTGSAAPGGAINIKIRGTSSFNGSSEPLYVVDGIILNPASQDVSNPISSTGQESQNALTSISPNDIASMEILKDASATAIYGSLGANGVVLITTKSGMSQKPKVTVSSNVEISQPYKKIRLLNLDEFVQYANEVGYKVSADTLVARDWQDYTMRTAVSTNNRVTVSGKTKSTNYYIAAGYLNNQGILKNTDVTQEDLRINLDQKIGDYVKVGIKSSLTQRVNNMTQGTEPGGTQNATRATNMLRQMLGSKPYLVSPDAASYEDDAMKGTDIWLNNYDDKSMEHRINVAAYLDIAFTKWLSFKTTFGTDYRYKERTRWYGEYIDNARNGRGGYSSLNAFRYNLDNVLSFNKEFNRRHRLNATLGMSVSNYRIQNNTVDAMDFPDHTFRAAGIYSARSQSPYYSEEESSLLSFFVRAIYSYRDRYVLTATMRADGSSKFSAGNKYSYFPSFAFAWNAKKESFLKDVEPISNLKLRLGWGMVGNQGVSPYQTLVVYNSMWMASPGSDYTQYPNGQFNIGVKPSLMANSNLKWETTEQYNVGLDFSMFNDRLSLTVDLYNKDTKDLLQSISIPGSTGFSTMWVNRGSINNKGLEIALDGVIIDSRNFSWTAGANISFNKNTIKDIGVPESQWGSLYGSGFLGSNIGNDATYFKMPANIYMEGEPFGLFFGFKTDGIVQAEDVESGNLPTYRGKTLQPGDIKYIDVNGDGDITDEDKTIIGDPNPLFTYGFNTNFTFKDWTLGLSFNGVYGNDLVNGNLMQENDVAPANPAQNINNIRAAAYFNAWTPENTDTNYPRLRSTTNSGDFTDRIVEDGSYLRLSAVTLGYTFHFNKRKWIDSINLNFTVRNPYVWTKYDGWDPDVSSYTNDSKRVGVDWSSYPTSRSYVCGILLNF